ncbi:SpaA isopeptide-forming pilin-related protein [Ligilactobacillus cholophilus]|uniref:SpaA isopeptide-forming pilin-related protein n=1 Tax=Ligilactobacillus cholophilus TaxID=3050131 RepID=UPI0025B0A540|nr:SpaA isopeptide-forming pilin-related protein [Ligilactobacillus cholophilus]
MDKRNFKFHKMTLVAIMTLICSVLINPLSAIANTTKAQDSANVKITSISSSVSNVKDGQRLKISVSFQGNGKVQPGEQIVMDLPEATDTTGGLYGLKANYEINASFGGKVVENAATAHVEGHTVTITFNEPITQLTSGFSGSFNFYVQAEKSLSGENAPVSPDWGVDIDGPTITIEDDPTADDNSGTTEDTQTKPDVSKAKLTKAAVIGKDGNINWIINGTVPEGVTGNIVITDDPNPAGKVDWSSFILSVTTSSGYSENYTINDLSRLGATIETDDPEEGAFVLTIPEWSLSGTAWQINYRTIVSDDVQVGSVISNDVTMAYPGNNMNASKDVIIESNGSGEITGLEGSTLTLIKQDETIHEALAGAGFELINQTTGTTVTTKSNADGEIIFNNLADGTYRLKETVAPDGYQLSDQEYQFTITDGTITDSNLPSDNIILNKKIAATSSSSSESSSSSSESSSSSSKDSSSSSSSVIPSSSLIESSSSSSKDSSSLSSSVISSSSSMESSSSSSKDSSSSSSSVIPSSSLIESSSSSSKDSSSSSSSVIPSSSSMESSSSSSISKSTSKHSSTSATVIKQSTSNSKNNSMSSVLSSSSVSSASESVTATENNDSSQKEQQNLPQTGERHNDVLSMVVGSLLLGIAGFVVLRKNN